MNLRKKIAAIQEDCKKGGIFSNLIVPCIVAGATAFILTLLLKM